MKAKQHASRDRDLAAAHTVDLGLNAPAAPLEGTVRALMEPHFNHSFGAVRVHSGVDAAQSAATLEAHAYTVGQDIVLGETASTQNLDLMAHELAHTVQQGQAAPRRGHTLEIAACDDASERNAHRAVSSGSLLSSEATQVNRFGWDDLSLPSFGSAAGVVGNAISSGAGMAGGVIGSIGSTVGSVVSQAGGMAGQGISGAGGLAGNAARGIGGMFGGEGSLGADLGGIAGHAFEQAGSRIGSSVSGTASQIGDRVTGNIARRGAQISGIGGGIGAGVAGLGSMDLDDLAGAAGGLVSGGANMIGNTVNGLGDFAERNMASIGGGFGRIAQAGGHVAGSAARFMGGLGGEGSLLEGLGGIAGNGFDATGDLVGGRITKNSAAYSAGVAGGAHRIGHGINNAGARVGEAIEGLPELELPHFDPRLLRN